MQELLHALSQERPVGTRKNQELTDQIEKRLKRMGYSVSSLPFDCCTWEYGPSAICIGGQRFTVEPSPFSEPFKGTEKVCTAETLEQLEHGVCEGKILLLSGVLTETPLSPKDYPFYYPDEHRQLINLIERKKPAAIVAATNPSELNGKTPHPLFEDGNFLIPSAVIDQQTFHQIRSLLTEKATAAELLIESAKQPAAGRQLIGSKKSSASAKRIIVGAHIDTQYGTPGALDNGMGAAVLLKTAELLAISDLTVDIVPFTSEEYYEASGELAYLNMIDSEPISLMINIDSPCHLGSQTAVSLYNFNEAYNQQLNEVLPVHSMIVKGKEWYAGDHAPFLFKGVPCMAVTSSDFFEGALQYTHTPNDTMDTVDSSLILPTANFVSDYILKISEMEQSL
ncbi:M28 family metallopeptidase [Enterococcus sp. LJL128]|uniref:M28 family metallopeptidase n=1 Tax=Enterococcus sp. LJL51 TaxID=3416656 RepID=UPI003CF4AD70